jgi:hypothetical protein
MKIKSLLVILFSVICLPCLANDTCLPILNQAKDLNGRSQLIRELIREASSRYGSQFPKQAGSLLRGNEWMIIRPIDLPSSHALYIASGADIYRVVADFPLANNYHLLDVWTQWGYSKEYAVFSVKHRLEELGSVQVEELGFLENELKSNSDLFSKGSARQYFEMREKSVGDPKANLPAVLKVLIEFGNKKIVKRFFLHPFDWSQSNNYDRILAAIPANEPLVGVLQAGITGSPYGRDLIKLLKRLAPNAWYVKEVGGTEFEEPLAKIRTGKKMVKEVFEKFLADVQPTDLTVGVGKVYSAPTINEINPNAVAIWFREKR